MTDTRPPREGYRAISFPSEFRDTADGGASRIVGHFSRFNVFNEIRSVVEGTFVEKIAPGAYRKTLAEHTPRVLFQHGKDPQIGDKPIAAPEILREDETGPYYEAQLFPSVPPLILDGLRAGQYGVSYRFTVVREDWNPNPERKRSVDNPNGLPERIIREAMVHEFGPVTFPADAGADVAVRSITDEMRPPTPSEPDAPSLDAAAQPHLEPERRDEPVEPIAAPDIKENARMSEYNTAEEKAARVTELKAAIRQQAEETTGVRSTEAQSQWDKDNIELDTLERDLKVIGEARDAVARLGGNAENASPAYVAPTIVRKVDDIYDITNILRSAPEVRDQGLRDNAMRAAETLRVSGDRYDQDKSRERLAELIDFVDSEDKEIAKLVLNTNSPQYRKAFNRYVASGGEERGTALAVGVDGTGGFSVPVAFDPTIIATGAWAAINPVRATARVETISGTDTWQGLTANAIVAARATEAAAATEQGPTFVRPEIIVKRVHAFVTASYEMVQDRPSLPGDLGVLFGEAKDNEEETSFTTGSGATVNPQGIGLKDAFTRADSATNDVVAVADVLAAEAALPIRHRFGAAWYLSRAAIRAIQAFETAGGQLFNSTAGYPAVGNPRLDRGGNTGLTLLGYPVYESPSMPWTPTTDDTTWGVLADLRNYVIVDRVGMSIKVIPDMLNGATPSFPTGEIGIYAFWRNNAKVINADGGRQGAVQ